VVDKDQLGLLLFISLVVEAQIVSFKLIGNGYALNMRVVLVDVVHRPPRTNFMEVYEVHADVELN
jgi:hypothetical protein